jgi:hypothetical protein
MNKKAVISVVVVIMLVLVVLAVVYAHNLYEVMLRVHGMG